jgi:hypothetical protein
MNTLKQALGQANFTKISISIKCSKILLASPSSNAQIALALFFEIVNSPSLSRTLLLFYVLTVECIEIELVYTLCSA